MARSLDISLASQFARIALGHVTREYPNKLDHVLTEPGDAQGPRALHPVFYGSFDWHSAVHGHWLLARLYRRFPALPEASAVRALLDSHLTHDNVGCELAYLSRPSSAGFERPYGWAWLLMLADELARHETAEGRRWHAALAPLAEAFAARFVSFLPRATYPVRAGVHSNTAFAMLLALDYARNDPRFAASCREKVSAWYGEDRDYRPLEPSQDEFLSPTLVEAAVMRAVLPREAFPIWFARFLPRLAEGDPATLFAPATVSDRSDGKIAHLDGLNLSRAWCWRLVLDGLPAEHKVRPRAEAAIDAHLDSALPHVAGDYMGEHWLASFALLALDHRLDSR